MAITNTTLTSTTPTTVFQAAGQQAITVMYICNTGNVDVTCNVYCANNGSSSSTDNMIYNQLLITAGNTASSGDTYVISTEKLILDNGDFVDVEANVANVVTVTVSSISV
jgi:hypothetical protein